MISNTYAMAKYRFFKLRCIISQYKNKKWKNGKIYNY